MCHPMNKINYYFVRHGETAANAEGIIQGWTDSPLNATGINTSHQLGETLQQIPFHLAYSSDLKRAKMTGEIILDYQKDPPQLLTMEGFREFNYGGLENELIENVWTESLTDKVKRLENEKVPSTSFVPIIIEDLMRYDTVGESEDFTTFWARIEEAVLSIHDEALEQRIEQILPEINVLIVSHDFPIRFLFHELLPNFDLTQPLEPSHYAQLSYYHGAYHLEAWNQA